MNPIIKHLAQVEEGMSLLDQDEIFQAIRIIQIVKSQQGTLYTFGNGGSHSTASHFANDLNKMARVKAVCVGDGIATMTAYGNDDGWEHMFSSHLAKVLTMKDGVVGISCGGSSRNVLNALERANSLGVLSIGMTGIGNGTPINELGLDAFIHARVPDIRVQEDLHLMVCHAIVRSLQEEE